MNNLSVSSYCRLVDAKIGASDKYLPAMKNYTSKNYANTLAYCFLDLGNTARF